MISNIVMIFEALRNKERPDMERGWKDNGKRVEWLQSTSYTLTGINANKKD